MEADGNKIIIQAPAFKRIFRGAQNITHVELFLFVQIVPRTDLSATLIEYSLGQIAPADCNVSEYSQVV